jgi:hypothetical protein
LLRALPVDIEEDIDAGRQYLLDGFARGAVIVAKDFCMFKKASLPIIVLNSS